jgi:hypothetical protein
MPTAHGTLTWSAAAFHQNRGNLGPVAHASLHTSPTHAPLVGFASDWLLIQNSLNTMKRYRLHSVVFVLIAAAISFYSIDIVAAGFFFGYIGVVLEIALWISRLDTSSESL